MKPISVVALFIAALLMFIGISGRETDRLLSNAVIVAASIIIGIVVVVWIIALVKNRNNLRD